ncbi:MAG TPA: hypothetical protein VG013_01710 [Gemmataceae bacterium]|jgi:hypothetical protein|nr:hypothetical protein [Gemmataceae bacterium]
MHFDAERVWANARQATTEDLLDRVTVYRSGMEPEAVDIIEAELRSRGVRDDAIREHTRQRVDQVLLLRPDGTARPCSFCHRPAVAGGWGWHRLSRRPSRLGWLWGALAGPLGWLALWVPVLPGQRFYCEEHRPTTKTEDLAEHD